MSFFKPGLDYRESFVASVTLFEMEWQQNKEAYASLIEEGFISDTDKNRFDILTKRFNYSERRSYPCVEVGAVSWDKKATTGKKTKEKLLLSISSLYCKHPTLALKGFAITYSHRGSELPKNFDEEAKKFIAGVVVPES